VSVNVTVSGSVPEVGMAVKLGSGTGSDTLMKVIWVERLDPPLLFAIRLIEKLPLLNITSGF